jgi:hypothetical protein
MNNFHYYRQHVRETDRLIIGSSDIPVIIKPRGSKIKKTQIELYMEKRNLVPGFHGNTFTRMGHELEPIIIAHQIRELYDDEMAYRFKVDYILHEEMRLDTYIPPTPFKPYTEAVHPEFPWAVAHADAVHIPANTDSINPVLNSEFLIEAKSGGHFARIRRDGMDGFDKEDLNPDGVPIDVMLQVQWQMMIYDIDFTYIVLLIDDNKFYVYPVPAIRKWWAPMMEKAARFHWHVINEKLPKPESFDDVKTVLPDVEEKAAYVVGERATMAVAMKEEYSRYKKLIKKYESAVDDIKDAAALLMGDSKWLYNGETGEKLFTQIYTQGVEKPLFPSSLKGGEYEFLYSMLESKGLIGTYDRRYVR